MVYVLAALQNNKHVRVRDKQHQGKFGEIDSNIH